MTLQFIEYREQANRIRGVMIDIFWSLVKN